MARLIEADELVKVIENLLYEPDSVQYVWSSDVLSAIRSAHTIPAIQVEWLKEQRDKRRAAAAAHSNISSMTVLEAINVVMELWEKEG